VSPATGQPASAAIYQLDSLVRRAPSLQLTADAKQPSVDAAVQGGL
jgi:NADH-quinone oxidoreductase subunit G